MTTERDRLNQLAFAEAKGRKEGKEEGREEGREEALIETARRMLRLKVDRALIAKATGLTEEALAKL